ncbi:hypothetical protein CC86DRAFT_371441 [Ophiobolus disseminans]|uniref:Glycosyl transferase CAP10 domain-containing protein n=1 Tax=Ophiobolus disseminans TaxID=1469910 RepID=A0A6A6ZXB5_9PLEO|nr:hypothetical protein CC86DRAFT_371441 [Ophiobolus disseminans]
MHPVVTLALENVANYRQMFAPLLFSILAAVAHVHDPVQHSLLITAVSWAIPWLYTIFKVGIWPDADSKRRNTSWLAGGFLAFAQICDRASADKNGTWATRSLLPLLVILTSRNDLLPKLTELPTYGAHDDAAKEPQSPSDTPSQASVYRTLAVVTGSAAAVLAIYSVPSTVALGLSSAIFTATGLVLLDTTTRTADNGFTTGAYVPVSANGVRTRRSSVAGPSKEQPLVVLRDFATALSAACGLASMLVEPSLSSAISWEPTLQTFKVLQCILWMIPVNVFANVLLFFTLSRQGAVDASLLSVFACICAKLHFDPSFMAIWFTCIYVLSALLCMSETPVSILSGDKRSLLRVLRRIILGASVLSIGLALSRYAPGLQHRQSTDNSPRFQVAPPASPFDPVPINLNNGHPAAQLVSAAESNFDSVLKHQSTTLADAAREYRRRYGIAPPPHFDRWYEFAVRNKVIMIDEYDMINEMLLPFWAIEPASIRSRITRELGGEDSALIGVAIRNGEIVNIEKGDEWQREATKGMMESFRQYLPDMDLGFNIHDEPRVVVPDSHLSSMVSKAQDEVLPRVAKCKAPRNGFSARPEDVNDGKRFVETYVSKFNRFAHQQTWTPSRLSCPTDSQAQTFEDYVQDNLTAYAAGPLNYVYNATAFSDICISPSLSSTFGFFERPNAFNIIHELTPVFSQSKISSFQDILYPSPWYWAGRVGYDKTHDTTWNNKTNALYWRGSTTGGFSRNGGWRRQHRQHIVQRLNAPDKARILAAIDKDAALKDEAKTFLVSEIDRRSLKHLVDVHFSHVGQCDPSDCDAQKEFFHVTERADGQNAWYFKHLLDMDGNAFSGRFYSFLKSRSLTYKMAVFREWHAEWLKPWVHYIPLSLKGDEHLDLVRWFSGDQGGGVAKGKGKNPDKSGNGDSEGEKKARQIAERSTEWHDKVLRNVDFEAWFFRLLLEYGRIIDDNREEIGYPGP